jgi:hypothetical protein
VNHEIGVVDAAKAVKGMRIVNTKEMKRKVRRT